MDFTIAAELVLFVLLLILSGLFSSSETSLFSLGKFQFEQMRRNGNPRLALIERMLSEPRRLIITILIGNEFVNVAASVISAALVIEFFGPENKLANLFIMVPILLLFGEITPKTLAIRNNIAFATYESVIIEWFAKMITPLRWLIRIISEFFLSLIVGSERSRGNLVTEDMLRTLAHAAVGEGTLDKDEAKFIDQIFDFGDRTIQEVLTPRSQIHFISSSMSLKQIINKQVRTRQTRMPVYGEEKDDILGILHARDLLKIDIHRDEPIDITTLLRPAYFVPESKQTVELFHSFRERKLSMALTVDEYGGVTGLVTMEDLMECIFGEIYSPSERIKEDKVEAETVGENSYRVDGMMTLDAFNEWLGLNFTDQNTETVAGMLLNIYGELPEEGTEIAIESNTFKVEHVEENRIKKILFTRGEEFKNKNEVVKQKLPDDNDDIEDSHDNNDTTIETNQGEK